MTVANGGETLRWHQDIVGMGAHMGTQNPGSGAQRCREGSQGGCLGEADARLALRLIPLQEVKCGAPVTTQTHPSP